MVEVNNLRALTNCLRHHRWARLAQGPCPVAAEVEDVQTRPQRQRRRAVGRLVGLLLAAGGFQFQTTFQASAAIDGHVLQHWPGLQGFGPGLAAAVSRTLAQHPGHTVRFDSHEHRLAVKEDLIQAQAMGDVGNSQKGRAWRDAVAPGEKGPQADNTKQK